MYMYIVEKTDLAVALVQQLLHVARALLQLVLDLLLHALQLLLDVGELVVLQLRHVVDLLLEARRPEALLLRRRLVLVRLVVELTLQRGGGKPTSRQRSANVKPTTFQRLEYHSQTKKPIGPTVRVDVQVRHETLMIWLLGI